MIFCLKNYLVTQFAVKNVGAFATVRKMASQGDLLVDISSGTATWLHSRFLASLKMAPN
jgi:hypothetical protein